MDNNIQQPLIKSTKCDSEQFSRQQYETHFPTRIISHVAAYDVLLEKFIQQIEQVIYVTVDIANDEY